MEKYEMVATTLTGLEQTLAAEIKELGGERVKVLKRAEAMRGQTPCCTSLTWHSGLPCACWCR